MEINGYPNYIIYNDGSVWSKRSKKFLKHSKDSYGYYRVNLYDNTSTGTCKHFKIHQLIAICYIPNPDNKRCVDHIDRNIINNSIINLRWCSVAENLKNTKQHKDNKSGFKGVSLDTRKETYSSRICINNKRIHIGTFETALEASNAYESKAKELCGDFYLARRV
jgi:hypothetical protein